MSDSLRIIFAGTTDFAAYHLNALLNSPHEVIGVLTRIDQPIGRGHNLRTCAVKKLAQQHNISVFQPRTLFKYKDQQNIKNLSADIIVVVAYGLIFPQAVLDMPRLGCINVHGSLLPRWRGAAPIQRALLAGDSKTGITIMQMDANIDTGAILYKTTCDILPNDTSTTLYAKLAQVGSAAMLITLAQLASGNSTAIPQDGTLATYANKLSKTEARINWQLPAIQLERCIRALNPWPGSYFQINGQTIKVWRAHATKQYQHNMPGTVLNVVKSGISIATGDGVLILTLLQLAGRKAMLVQDLLNSRREFFINGTILD